MSQGEWGPELVRKVTHWGKIHGADAPPWVISELQHNADRRSGTLEKDRSYKDMRRPAEAAAKEPDILKNQAKHSLRCLCIYSRKQEPGRLADEVAGHSMVMK